MQSLDDELDQVVNESSEDSNDKESTKAEDKAGKSASLPPALLTLVTSDLERVRGDLEACQDCREEGLARADKIRATENTSGEYRHCPIVTPYNSESIRRHQFPGSG